MYHVVLHDIFIYNHTYVNVFTYIPETIIVNKTGDLGKLRWHHDVTLVSLERRGKVIVMILLYDMQALPEMVGQS